MTLLILAVQPKSIPPPLTLVGAALLVLSVGIAGAGPQRKQLDRQTETPFNQPASDVLSGLEGWVESPEHVRLFAPEAHLSQYRAFVSASPDRKSVV